MTAMNFPDNPTDQQVYNDYIWIASEGVWRSAVMVGASPCGSIMPFAGSTIPAGWLECDGSAVSRTTYSSLFAALGGISSPWGLGNGSTTFNLPDLRSRVPVGKAVSGQFSAVGAIGGAETMSLSEAHIAAHSHSFSATTSWQGDHQHAPPVAVSYGGSAGNYRNLLTTNTPLWSGADWNCAVSPGGGHNHTVSGTTGAAGSGAAFGIVQPYAVVKYIIKFTAVVASTDTEIAVRMGQAEATVAAAVSSVNTAVAAVASKAPIASPTFTGIVRMPGQPAFSAYASAATFDATRIMPYNVATVNIGGHYNTSTYRFTAPVDGAYLFSIYDIGFAGYTSRFDLLKNGSSLEDQGKAHQLRAPNASDYASATSFWLVQAAANDYFEVRIYAGRSHGTVEYSWFQGHLIG